MMEDVFVHTSSYVDDGAIVGAGTKIWHFCHVMSSARIGIDCILGQNVFVGADVVIGNHVKIQNNVSIYTGVTIEDDVFLGPSVVFTNVHNPRSFIERKDEFRKTWVKSGATIGANATLICGVTIGEYSFIGAGATITKDVPPYAVWLGNPGRQVGWMSKAGEQLFFNYENVAECPRNGDLYKLEDGRVFEM